MRTSKNSERLHDLLKWRPLEARTEIIAALEATRGHVPKAAELLAVPVRSLQRFVHDPGLAAALIRIRAEPAPAAPSEPGEP